MLWSLHVGQSWQNKRRVVFHFGVQHVETQHVKHNFYRHLLFWFIYRLLFWNFRHRLVRHYWYTVVQYNCIICLFSGSKSISVYIFIHIYMYIYLDLSRYRFSYTDPYWPSITTWHFLRLYGAGACGAFGLTTGQCLRALSSSSCLFWTRHLISWTMDSWMVEDNCDARNILVLYGCSMEITWEVTWEIIWTFFYGNLRKHYCCIAGFCSTWCESQLEAWSLKRRWFAERRGSNLVAPWHKLSHGDSPSLEVANFVWKPPFEVAFSWDFEMRIYLYIIIL